MRVLMIISVVLSGLSNITALAGYECITLSSNNYKFRRRCARFSGFLIFLSGTHFASDNVRQLTGWLIITHSLFKIVLSVSSRRRKVDSRQLGEFIDSFASVSISTHAWGYFFRGMQHRRNVLFLIGNLWKVLPATTDAINCTVLLIEEWGLQHCVDKYFVHCLEQQVSEFAAVDHSRIIIFHCNIIQARNYLFSTLGVLCGICLCCLAGSMYESLETTELLKVWFITTLLRLNKSYNAICPCQVFTAKL